MIKYLHERLKNALRSAFSISERDAARFSSGFMAGIEDEFGGEEIYIPKKDRERLRREALTMFNGTNHADICIQLGVPRRTLYRWISDDQRTREDTNKRG